jgi:DNA-binding beta-propeller fold protein YncE
MVAWLPLAFCFLSPQTGVGAATRTIPELEYETHPFRVVRPEGVALSMQAAGAVAVRANGHIVVASPQGQIVEWERRTTPVRDAGRFVSTYGAGLSIATHILRVDADDNLWSADEQAGTLFEFDADRRSKMRTAERALKRPLDVAFDGARSVFVLDAKRIVKFDAEGNELAASVELRNPHAVATDAAGNVYVADGGAHAIQVFSNALRLIRTIEHIGVPWAICITAADLQVLFSASNPDAGDPLSPNAVSEVYKIELDGTVIGKFGRGDNPFGNFRTIHQIACSNEREILSAGPAGVHITTILK